MQKHYHIMSDDLQRFIDAHHHFYPNALKEIRDCRKKSHWMWWIFPQIIGLGFTETSRNYAIQNLKEAADFVSHPLLGKNLVEISQAVLSCNRSATEIFGSPDDKKLRSSMTLFSLVPGANGVFKEVLEKFFKGQCDNRTLDLLEQNLSR